MLPDAIDLQSLSRVLVIKLRHHGDVLLSSPVFSVLKARAPHLAIDALVYADTAALLEGHPAIERIHRIDRGWKKLGVTAQARAEWRLLSELREARYGLLVHLTEHPRGAWLARLLGPRYSVARKHAGGAAWWNGSFTHHYRGPLATPRHAVEANLDALRRLGVHPEAHEKRLVLCPSAEAQARIDAELTRLGLEHGRFIHLHPGSRWQFKCWPAERVAALLRELAAEGQVIVLTAAPDAREMKFIDTIQDSAAGAAHFELCGRLSLAELAALTARARLFVGVDSAPMHIAAAMGTPTVALFGPSGEQEWGPWQVAHRVLASAAHTCRPCGIDGCGGGKRSECLEAIAVATVKAAIADLLSETDAR